MTLLRKYGLPALLIVAAFVFPVVDSAFELDLIFPVIIIAIYILLALGLNLSVFGFEPYELLTTERALAGAPAALSERAANVHLVPGGSVPDAAAAIIDEVAHGSLVALGGGRPGAVRRARASGSRPTGSSRTKTSQSIASPPGTRARPECGRRWCSPIRS